MDYLQRFLAIHVVGACFLAIAANSSRAQDTIRVVKAVCYRDAKEGKFHQLDMYLPTSKSFPVVVFAHGGAWMFGDKSEYEFLGRYFAERGIGVAVVNYRLSPKIQHPGHVKDVAKATAWVYANIGKYGGDRTKLFLGGYSAGGHLVSLLGTNEAFLPAEGLSLKSIRGIVSISGVYLADGLPALDAIFPKVDRDHCFAMKHIQAGGPSFLLFRAEKEIFGLDKQAECFHAKLRENGCNAQLRDMEGVDHFGICTEAAIRNRLGARMVTFLRGDPALAKVGE